MVATLIVADGNRPEALSVLLRGPLESGNGRIYLYLDGTLASSPPSLATLDLVAAAFAPVALRAPTRDLVPLLPAVGWTPELVARIPDLAEGEAWVGPGTEGLFEHLQGARGAAGLRPLGSGNDAAPTGARGPAPPGEGASPLHAASPPRVAPTPSSLGILSLSRGEVLDEPIPASATIVYPRSAVGGTFDRLHAGHRLLLASTSIVTSDEVYVGVTDAKLLSNKRGLAAVREYAERESGAVDYLRAVRPGLGVTSGALVDPNEPTAAATEAGIVAIVVSEETVPGARAIDAYRRQRDLPPIATLVVPVLDDIRGDKLSSTQLRG